MTEVAKRLRLSSVTGWVSLEKVALVHVAISLALRIPLFQVVHEGYGTLIPTYPGREGDVYSDTP